MQHGVYTTFVPNFSDLLVARYIMNNTHVNQFHDQYTDVMGIALHQRMLSTQEYCTLIDLIGTAHLSSVQFHSIFVDALNEPERTDQESYILLKILGQGFMNLLPPLPFPGDMKAVILDEKMYHCVRCHEGFLTRNNGHRACVLPSGSTVRHTISPGDVTGYGVHFGRCIDDPDQCATLAAMKHSRNPFRGGRRGAMY
jgi:hypothetical protein